MSLNITIGKGDTISNHPYKKVKNCDRIIITNNNSSYPDDHKICEIITFAGSNAQNYAIAIGMNPALCNPARFDATNRYLAKYIKNSTSYDGYVLFNLYTILTSNCELLRRYIKHNPRDIFNDFEYCLHEILMYTNNDVYIFWGPKVKQYSLINYPMLINYFYNNINTRNIYFSVNNGASNIFEHPANCKNNLSFVRLTQNNINLVF